MNIKLIDFDISNIDYTGYNYNSKTKVATIRVKTDLNSLTKGHCMYCYDEIPQQTAVHQDHYIDQAVANHFVNHPQNIVYSCCDCNSAKNKPKFREDYKTLYEKVKPIKSQCDLICGSKQCYTISSAIYRYTTGLFNPVSNKISDFIELSLPARKFVVILPKESKKVQDYIQKDREKHIKILNLNSKKRIGKIIDVVCNMIIENNRIPTYNPDIFKNLLASQVIKYFLELERTEGFSQVLAEAKYLMIQKHLH